MNRKSAGRFGAITYLPTFFQIVRGVTPTLSGVRLLPPMAGLLATSIAVPVGAVAFVAALFIPGIELRSWSMTGDP